MVDIFPIINRFPLWMSKWKRDALAWHDKESKMHEGFYREVEEKMVGVMIILKWAVFSNLALMHTEGRKGTRVIRAFFDRK